MKRKRPSRGISNIIILILGLISFRCINTKERIDNGKINVTATTGIIADAIANIGGDKINLESLMGPGVDPHLYKTSYRDIEKLRNADIIFFNGLHLEGKMQDVLNRLKGNKKVFAISDGLDKKSLKNIPGFDNTKDPHFWFNIILWKQAVQFIGEKLILADPQNGEYYYKNLHSYLLKLDNLDHLVRSNIALIPPSQRVLITAHDAFGYFGDEYKVEVKGLQGISTMSDFGLNDISSLVAMISGRKIKAIFVETSVPKKSIEAVVEGCKQKGHKVVIGGSLYSDALGDKNTPQGTYIGMVSSNVNTIVNSLK